jgi:hypothetical protein
MSPQSGFLPVTASKMVLLAMSLMFLCANGLDCTSNNMRNGQGKDEMPIKTIEDVLKEHSKELMFIPGVVGTALGLCKDEPCIKVFVIQETPELKQRIPHRLGGYPVSVEETGEIRALPEKKK